LLSGAAGVPSSSSALQPLALTIPKPMLLRSKSDFAGQGYQPDSDEEEERPGSRRKNPYSWGARHGFGDHYESEDIISQLVNVGFTAIFSFCCRPSVAPSFSQPFPRFPLRPRRLPPAPASFPVCRHATPTPIYIEKSRWGSSSGLHVMSPTCALSPSPIVTLSTLDPRSAHTASGAIGAVGRPPPTGEREGCLTSARAALELACAPEPEAFGGPAADLCPLTSFLPMRPPS
jgi:hypothetical protein